MANIFIPLTDQVPGEAPCLPSALTRPPRSRRVSGGSLKRRQQQQAVASLPEHEEAPPPPSSDPRRPSKDEIAQTVGLLSRPEGSLDDDLGMEKEEDVAFALSKLSELDPEAEKDQDAIDRLIRRDVRSIRNDVNRALNECLQKCPGKCESCGAEKIKDVSEKLEEYSQQLEDLEEEEAKEAIRADLMNFL